VQKYGSHLQYAILLIELEGSTIGPGGIGLDVRGGSSTVKGCHHRFIKDSSNQTPTGVGIRLSTKGNNTIQGNFIGTDALGLFATDSNDDPIGNQIGILIDNINNNTMEVRFRLATLCHPLLPPHEISSPPSRRRCATLRQQRPWKQGAGELHWH